MTLVLFVILLNNSSHTTTFALPFFAFGFQLVFGMMLPFSVVTVTDLLTHVEWGVSLDMHFFVSTDD